MSASLAAVEEYFERRPWAIDVVLITLVTVVAAALRLTLLGDIPYGVHPDEAQLGTDVHKILDGDFIGVYTHAALGQPAGHSYFTLPSIWLLGDTAFALRLPLALVGVAAIPLLYLLVRVTYARTEAFFASAMLAVSYWHLLYSRVAHWSISYGTVLLAACSGSASTRTTSIRSPSSPSCCSSRFSRSCDIAARSGGGGVDPRC